jgi:hypothetical protein
MRPFAAPARRRRRVLRRLFPAIAPRAEPARLALTHGGRLDAAAVPGAVERASVCRQQPHGCAGGMSGAQRLPEEKCAVLAKGAQFGVLGGSRPAALGGGATVVGRALGALLAGGAGAEQAPLAPWLLLRACGRARELCV